MIKRLLFSVICLCAVMLSGCQEVNDPVPETEQRITAEQYDVGQFRVLVPEPWKVFPIEDPFTQGRPVKTDCVFLRKGGDSDWRVFEKPYIRISYYSPDIQMQKPEPDGVTEKNAQTLPPLKLGTLNWNGYLADSYQGNACIGKTAVLWTENAGHQYMAVVWLESGGESVSLEDRDLQRILASLSPST